MVWSLTHLLLVGSYMYLSQGHTHKQQPTSQTSKHSSQLSSPHHLSTHRLLPNVSLVPEEVCLHRTLSWNRPPPHVGLHGDPALQHAAHQ